MDFLDISKIRVTVRKFAQIPVEQEKINKILEAGRCSPTTLLSEVYEISEVK